LSHTSHSAFYAATPCESSALRGFYEYHSLFERGVDARTLQWVLEGEGSLTIALDDDYPCDKVIERGFRSSLPQLGALQATVIFDTPPSQGDPILYLYQPSGVVHGADWTHRLRLHLSLKLATPGDSISAIRLAVHGGAAVGHAALTEGTEIAASALSDGLWHEVTVSIRDQPFLPVVDDVSLTVVRPRTARGDVGVPSATIEIDNIRLE
jgi:hypothetical protein